MSCTLIWRDSVGVDSQLANETLALAYRSRRKVATSAWLFSPWNSFSWLQRAKAEPMFTLVLLLLLSLSTWDWYRSEAGRLPSNFPFPNFPFFPHYLATINYYYCLLMMQRYHVIPTVLYYWLTSLVRNQNQTSDISHRHKQNIHFGSVKIFKWLIHNHNIFFRNSHTFILHLSKSSVDYFF